MCFAHYKASACPGLVYLGPLARMACRLRARCECLWRALRQDLQVACASTIVSASKLQVSPLRMTIEPSCYGRDDSSGVVYPSLTPVVVYFYITPTAKSL